MIVELHAFDLAVAHADEPLRQRRDLGVMGDDRHGGVIGLAHIPEQRQHLSAGFGVQRASGLVAQKQGRVFAKGPGNGDALLFAARKLGGEVVHALSQTDAPHHFHGIQRVGAHLTGQFHVFQRGQVGHQVIKLKNEAHVQPTVLGQFPARKAGDLLAAYDDLAGGDFVHAAQQVQNRGLARAAGAQHHRQLALLHFEADVVGRHDLFAAHLVFFRNVFKGNITHTGSSFPNGRIAKGGHSYRVKSSRMRQRRQ